MPLGWIYVGLLALLYLPIGLLFLFSFNSDTRPDVPDRGPHARLVRRGASTTPQMLEAARNSLVVGVTAATVATALGTGVAASPSSRFRFRGRAAAARAWRWLPLVVPFVVLACRPVPAVRHPGRAAWDPDGWRGALGDRAALRDADPAGAAVGMDPALEDAAMDLGATYPSTLRRVVLPLIGPVAAVRLADMLHRVFRRDRHRHLPRRRRSRPSRSSSTGSCASPQRLRC